MRTRKPVLVTGANGFIGSRLFERLKQDGERACALTRKCDLTRWDAVKKAFAAAAPAVVIHAAGSLLDAAQEGYFNNVFSTANVIRAAVKYKVRRIIFLSSNMVYGRSYRIRLGDEERSSPDNWYARSKHICERMLRDHSDAVEAIVLRLPSVLGAQKETGGLVGEMVDALKRKDFITVHGRGRARRQFVDIRDLTGIIRRSMRCEMPKTRFLTVPVVGQARSIRQIAETIVAVNGRGRLKFDRGRRDAPDKVAAPAILRRRLGRGLTVSLEDSIRELLNG